MKSLAIVALLVVVVPCVAADQPSPGALTEKEIAEGWISLFDGKTTFGWTSPNDSKWSVVDGMLAPQKGKQGRLKSNVEFADFELKVEYYVDGNSKEPQVHLRRLVESPPDQAFRLYYRGEGWSEYNVRVVGNQYEEVVYAIGS